MTIDSWILLADLPAGSSNVLLVGRFFKINKIYLHIPSFLHTGVAQSLGILPQWWTLYKNNITTAADMATPWPFSQSYTVYSTRWVHVITATTSGFIVYFHPSAHKRCSDYVIHLLISCYKSAWLNDKSRVSMETCCESVSSCRPCVWYVILSDIYLLWSTIEMPSLFVASINWRVYAVLITLLWSW